MNPPALPGVYEAKVVTVSGNTLSVLVPQVFRDQQVPVTKWVGTQPLASSMGVVSFVGGDPAWPVWLGQSVMPVSTDPSYVLTNALSETNKTVSAVSSDVSTVSSELTQLMAIITSATDFADLKADVAAFVQGLTS